MGVQRDWFLWWVKGKALAGAGQSPAQYDNRTVRKNEIAKPKKTAPAKAIEASLRGSPK